MKYKINYPIEKTVTRNLNPAQYLKDNIPSGYLRISITDFCNMNCDYCHNEGQMDKNMTFLSIDDLYYIVMNAKRYGLMKIKLTGGEPLLHSECRTMIRMLKEDLSIPVVGLNTNGILINKLLPIVSDGFLNEIVVGVDYANKSISKKSPSGVSSKIILNNIIEIKKQMKNIHIACVYDGNNEKLADLVNWCIENEVILKILEIYNAEICSAPGKEFISMIEYVINKFNMKTGYNDTLSDYFGMINNVPKVYFFHSYCQPRECDICNKIHMRITSKGYIKSCVLNRIEYPLLLPSNFDENFKKAIENLGHTPEYYIQN